MLLGPAMDDFEVFGAEDAASRLADLIQRAHGEAPRLAADDRPLLAPPVELTRDHADGLTTAESALVVFGAYGTPWSKPLERVLAETRRRHLVVWRHYPDPEAHPHAGMFALAAEAAATGGRFWALTREMLRMHHDDPAALHGAVVRAGLDPQRTIETMQAGIGTDRIVEDVASALASGVEYSPALFVNGERYTGELDVDAVMTALES
jgi:protein-disulfide isomerase